MDQDHSLAAPEVCPACGTPFPAGAKGVGCPVCLMRGALESEVAGEGDSQRTLLGPDIELYLTSTHEQNVEMLGSEPGRGGASRYERFELIVVADPAAGLAGVIASQTVYIPQLQATAPVLELIVEEAIIQDAYMNALTDGFGVTV